MKRPLVVATLIFLVAGTGLWRFLQRPSGEEPEAKPTALVELAPLKLEPIAALLEAFGVVEPSPGGEQVTSAPYDCIIAKVMVAAGDRVAAGDVLLEIEPSPDSRLTLKSARNALIVAEKALQAAQERFELRLIANQDLILARQAEADARAKVMSLEARGLGGDGRIRARMAGVVSKREANAGSLVLLGAPLVSVAGAERLEARLSAEGSARAQVAKGQVVTMTSADDPAAPAVTGAVRSVGAALNVAAGSLDIRVNFPASAPLMLGEHVRALIEVRTQANAFVVPRNAVLPDADAQVLFTAKEGKAIRHEVTVGIAAGDRLEVQGGDLSAGDLVVVTGNYELTDGMAVQVAVAPGKTDSAAEPVTRAAPETDKDP